MDASVIILIITIAVFAVVTVLFIRSRNKKKKMTADEFLTARNSTGWLQIGLSIEAVVMGCWALFSVPEMAALAGWPGVVSYAISQGGAIMLFAWLGVKLRRTVPESSTMTEFALARYGKGMYVVALIVSVFYMAIALASEMTGITSATLAVFGIPVWITALALVAGVSIYTVYGGIKASLFADVLQTLLIIPTLLIAFFSMLLLLGGFDGLGQLFAAAGSEAYPAEMFTLGYSPGWWTGLSLLLGIFCSNVFDNSYWQRSFACKDEKTVRKGFMFAGILNVPLIILCGSFGLMAMATVDIQSPSIALFELLHAKAPAWLSYVVMIAAIALVMSTAGALMNGISSVIASEVKRNRPHISGKKLIKAARIITIIIAICAAAVSLAQMSVMYLFYIADLVCAGACVPCFYGLFNKKIRGVPAFIAAVVGMIVGFFFFPDPAFSNGGDLTTAFLAAFGASTVITVVTGFFGKPVSLEEVRAKIVTIQEEQAENVKDLEA